MSASRNIAFFIAVSFFIVACSKRTTDAGFGKLEKKRTSELVDQLDVLSAANWDFLSTKINVRFNSREQKQSFKTTLKMKKDSLINATITFAAIPIINAILSVDSLKVVNKKDKCFILEDLKYLKRKFDLPFEYEQVEELVLGYPLAWDRNSRYHQLDDEQYYVVSSHKKRFVMRREGRSEDEILIRYFLTPKSMELAQVILDSPQDTTSVRIQYFDRYSDVGVPMPQRTEINIITPRDTIFVEMKFQKPEIEKEKTIFLVIPENYEKCN